MPAAYIATQNLLKNLERGLESGILDEEFIVLLNRLIRKAICMPKKGGNHEV